MLKSSLKRDFADAAHLFYTQFSDFCDFISFKPWHHFISKFQIDHYSFFGDLPDFILFSPE